MQSIFHHRATRANLTNCLQSHKNKQFAQTYKEWNRIGVTYSRSFSFFWVTRHCEYVNSGGFRMDSEGSAVYSRIDQKGHQSRLKLGFTVQKPGVSAEFRH